ncbi:MAG: N-acetylmuramoyl-L-alanine amidase, partial [Desulfobacterales bacterium]
LLFWCDVSQALTPRQVYGQAEVCYKELRHSSHKMKYRHNWLGCIDKFQQVHRLDPSGAWAAAGLYRSAKLYQELAKRSGKKSDFREARDIFERIVRRFPGSRYRGKATAEIQKLSSAGMLKRKTAKKKSIQDGGNTSEDDYFKAESCYNKLRQSRRKMKYRDNWLRCIDKFHSVYRKYPDSGYAAAGLYMAGKLYADLYQYSNRNSDLHSGYEKYMQIIDQYPQSRYKMKALSLIDTMPAWVKTEPNRRKDDIANMIDALAKTTPIDEQDRSQKNRSYNTGLGKIQDLRFWSNPNYTRLVIDSNRELSYDHHLLKKDPSLEKPPRLYVDLKDSRLGENIKKIIPINDDLLMDARAGQYTNDSVRVVVDIKSFKSYKIFSLKDPFRIVIDVWGAVAEKTLAKQKSKVTLKKNGKLPTSALAKQLALGISRIVIDPGHGGRDYGAPGYLKGIFEKDIALQISRKLAKMIRRELKCQVFLTRNSDKFLTLEERTAIANTKSADLFISIHTNSHRDRNVFGIETYFLNLATDDEAIRVAAIENATSTKNISDLQNILFDLVQNAKINESSRLASHVQGAMISILKSRRYSRINDKGVKQAPFYVLLGAQMPAVLVETSFISNPRECKRLINPKYQQRLCEAIVDGIKKYIRETTPTAYLKLPSDSANNG